MNNYNLNYCISKQTPASPKVMKEILDIQAIVNGACSWTQERLSLSGPNQTGRTGLGYAFMRFATMPGHNPSATPFAEVAPTATSSNVASTKQSPPSLIN